MNIYVGRETRHRAKNLAHATDYEFRLKVRLLLALGISQYRASPSR